MPSLKISNNPNFSELDTFLKQNRATTGGTFTHTSISGSKGSFYIEDTDKFIDIYHDHIFKKGLQGYLTEGIRDCEITPVKIDIDLRSYKNVDKPTRLYEMDDIIQICQRYMESMEFWLEDPDPKERYCFILEKPDAIFDKDKSGEVKVDSAGKKKIKDGVHIMFPNICTKTHLQLQLRNEVYKNIGDVLDKYEYDNSYADIFDKAVIDRNNWQMYGSTKSHTSYTYKVTKILEVYKDHYKEIPLETFTTLELVKLLSVRNKEDEALIKYEKQSLVNDCQENYIKINKTKSRTTQNKKNKASKADLQLICGDNSKDRKGYINCLNISRARKYDSWIEIGWALHNIDNYTKSKDGEARKLAEEEYPDDYTKSSWCDLLVAWYKWGTTDGSGYEQESMESYKETWDIMRYDGLGIGSLKLWARDDNPELYNKIVENDLHSYFMKTCGKKGGTSFDVANLMYQCYKDDFVCVSIKDTLWYYYDQDLHRWVEDDKGIRLKMKISTEIWKKFSDKGNTFKPQSPEDTDIETKRDSLQKTASRLKDTSFKGNIMTECSELFYDKTKTFYDKLDSNHNLLGFNNGVYDLKHGEHRRGRPEDYITMSTGVNYIKYDPYSEEIQGINKFLSEILTIENVRIYVVKLMATFISGSTKSEKFHVWSGSGGNGKSKLIELLEKGLGDYAGKMNISNLTQKRGNAGAANPELSRTKGRRFINMQEPDEQCTLNVGLMKEITGGDKIIARALYKEPQEFKPQFKMVLTCNARPQLPPDDDATWRRVVLVEYTSRFKPEPKGHWENKNKQTIDKTEHVEHINKGILTDQWIPDDKLFPQFPIDESLNDKFDDWAEPFISMLIHTFIKNKHIDLREPEEVREYTNKYRDQNNHFKEFMNDKIEILSNDTSDSVIKIDQLFSEYKDWYKDNLGTSTGQKRQKELKTFMDKEFGDYWVEGKHYTKRGYRGIRIISQHKGPDHTTFIDDEEEEGDELN